MRIKNSFSSRAVDKKESGPFVKKAKSDSSFSSALACVQGNIDSYARDVETLKDEIDIAGGRLEQEPTLENFGKFRDLLSQLVRRVGAEAYRLEKIGGTPNNPRYFEEIRIINKEADELYQMIVSRQRDRMAIVEKVIGIKGLVVDLVT